MWRKKPKYGVGSYVALCMFAIFPGIFLTLSAFCFINGSSGFGYLVCSVPFLYILYISPQLQNPKNFSITYDNNKLSVFYKSREVLMDYVIDENGKIGFGDNNNKRNCLTYADGRKVGYTDSYKIINYMQKWLWDNDLMSESVTVTFD